MKWSVIPALLLVLLFGGLARAAVPEDGKAKKRLVLRAVAQENAPEETKGCGGGCGDDCGCGAHKAKRKGCGGDCGGGAHKAMKKGCGGDAHSAKAEMLRRKALQVMTDDPFVVDREIRLVLPGGESRRVFSSGGSFVEGDGDVEVFVLEGDEIEPLPGGKGKAKVRVRLHGEEPGSGGGDGEPRFQIQLEGDGGWGDLPPEAKKQVMQSLKQLPPEIRKQVEKALRSGHRDFSFGQPLPPGMSFGGAKPANPPGPGAMPGHGGGDLVGALNGLRQEIAGLRRDQAAMRKLHGGPPPAGAAPRMAVRMPAPPQAPEPPEPPKAPVQIYRAQKAAPGRVVIEEPKKEIVYSRKAGKGGTLVLGAVPKKDAAAGVSLPKPPAPKPDAGLAKEVAVLKAQMKSMHEKMAKMMHLLQELDRRTK